MLAQFGKARQAQRLARARMRQGGPPDDGPSAAVIVGDPGSGKTRLLAELASRLADMTQLSVVGYEPERQVPVAAAAELLRTLRAVPDGGDRLRAVLSGPERAPTMMKLREGNPHFLAENGFGE